LARERHSGGSGRLNLLQAGKYPMSFGVALRNAVSIGLGGIATLFSGTIDTSLTVDNLLTESGANLVQENGDYILLE
jgi:N-acetylmuramic acid 6-phosphate (MurNAc-6-P) etherase